MNKKLLTIFSPVSNKICISHYHKYIVVEMKRTRKGKTEKKWDIRI